MQARKPWQALWLLAAFALSLFALGTAAAQTHTPLARQISAGGAGTFQPQALGGDAVQAPEIDDFGGDADAHDDDGGLVNRSLPTTHPGTPASSRAGRKAKSNPQVNLGFDGLNFRQQRLANNGKQFSVEPPDQGLCGGNGYVLESANDVLNVFDASGNQVLGVTDLNSFYGYAPAIVRRPASQGGNLFGPSITDPSCLFDSATQRWFHVVLTLDRINVDSNGQSNSQSLTGRNHLDIAVSNDGNPLDGWVIYRVPVQDDGTEGTPDHGCPANPTNPTSRTHPHACLGDYPHIGADANGFYISTNEFCFFPNCFNAAQVYAFSKHDLANHQSSVTMFQYDTNDTPAAGLPGFTVWPSYSPGTNFASAAGGTEYFLSSFAVFTGLDNRLALWALSNTQALNSGAAPTFSNSIVTTEDYANGPRAFQPGSGTNDQSRNWPLGQCIEDATCNLFLNGIPVGVSEVIGRVNGNDSRVQQVMFANGKLWTALGTGIITDTDSTPRVGIAYFVLTPQNDGVNLKGKVAKQGYVALDHASVIYPTTTVTESGRGVISFTLTGDTTYPSVGYVALDSQVGAGDVHTAQAGSGLQDGFTEYNNIFGGRPRWGDYGAGVADGNSIWFATEYINQSCDLATYEASFGSSFGSCGGTRTSLGNWATRITKVTP